jgi:hypothetical protein
MKHRENIDLNQRISKMKEEILIVDLIWLEMFQRSFSITISDEIDHLEKRK